jgi:hypothetical protein
VQNLILADLVATAFLIFSPFVEKIIIISYENNHSSVIIAQLCSGLQNTLWYKDLVVSQLAIRKHIGNNIASYTQKAKSGLYAFL